MQESAEPAAAGAAAGPARKLNVLHLRSCRGVGGGPEKTILFSTKEVDQDSFNMHIAYLKSRDDPDFDLDKRAAAMGIRTFVTIEESHKFDVGALKALLRLLRETKTDILDCHCYKSDLYGLILRRFHPMKVITTAHGPLASFKFFWSAQNWRVRYVYDQIDLRILKYFDRVIMVSDTMRSVIKRYRVPDEKLIWIRNAIDCEFFRRDPERRLEFRRSQGIPADAVVIGAVGRLNAEKDYPTFLRTAQLMLSENRDLWFTIAGGGPLEDELKRLAFTMGLADRFKFLGHFQDVRKLYDALDVYVLSSTREGLPNTVLEAMAMEVPIVATDIDGVGEAVVHDRDALLVPPQDPKRLAEAVRTILSDDALRQRLRSAARRRVEEKFSFAERMRRMEDIYREVMHAG